jgi:4-hydroxy-tetrahydrodipicolinate reductase
MSLGINLLESIVKIASSKLDSSFDIKINETHHKHKIDAPSGTAIMLGKAAASGKNKKLENVMKINRTNTIGKNIKNKIVMSSFRKGETIGDHEVIFSSNDETIKIQHIAENRGIFANGALQAVKWGMDKGPGLFSMTDVLNI